MEKSSFEKFKDIIRRRISIEEEFLNELLVKRQDIYQKITKSVENEPYVIGVKLNGDSLEIIIHGKRKKIEQKVLKACDKLLSEYDCIMENVEKTKFILYRLKCLVSSFDNEKAINVNDKLYDILNALFTFYSTNLLTLEDFNIVLGSSIHLASKKRNENPAALEEAAVRLAKFYNIKGEFLFGADDSYLDAFNNLFRAMFENTAFVINLEHFEKVLEASQKLDNLYQEYCANYIAKPIESIKDIPINESFCLSGTEETTEIDNKTIKEVIEGFDLELWQKANLKVQELRHYDTIRMQLLEILNEIKSIKTLYLETNDNEDKLYLQEELATLFDKLAELLEEKEEKSNDNNLVFLTDKNGVCYFSEDVMSLDKGIRKRSYNLLNRIKVENAKTFNKIPIDNYNVFQVFNKEVQILFLELYPGIYLVIGVCTMGRKNTDILNRISNPNNKKYIDDLILMIKDEEYRMKLLHDHATFVLPGALNRTRENIDNN